MAEPPEAIPPTPKRSRRKPAAKPLVIGGRSIAPGERATIHLPSARLYTFTEMSVPVHVIRGKTDGPTLFLSAAVHGDEVQGVEIVRQLLALKRLRRLKGALLAVPILNVYGFANHSRYLPDRRDLNRSFPGSAKGSLASRLARIFTDEIVSHAQYGIDLHTGSHHRMNLPQSRVNLDDPQARALAMAFGAPVVLDASLRDGSLRQAGAERGVSVLVYEAGEALRFDPLSIRIGVHGVLMVMEAVGMLTPPSRRRKTPVLEPLVARSSFWVRAPASGLFQARARLGAHVEEGETLGTVVDPFGQSAEPVVSTGAGLVIGKHNMPLTHGGDALFHIARLEDAEEAASTLEAVRELHDTGKAGAYNGEGDAVWQPPYEFLD